MNWSYDIEAWDNVICLAMFVALIVFLAWRYRIVANDSPAQKNHTDA